MTFQSARTRLTVIYTLLLACILVIFSFIIYSLAMEEVYRSVQQVRISMRDEFGIFMRPEKLIIIDTQALALARKNILIRLFGTNVVVLTVAAGASYYLAGRTLEPIQRMTRQQQQFVGDASHELRTPLTVMKSTTEVTLRDPHLTLADAKLALEDNLEEINRLQRLTNNLLTLSVSEDGIPLKLSAVSLANCVDQAIQVVSTLAADKQVQISTSEIEVDVLADQDSLIEVLVIFLENAVKYSPESSDVKIFTSFRGESVLIHIQDYGLGIDRADIPHLFDRFYRSESSRTSKGFGLGLSIAKKLVEAQKGCITVKSTPAKGSTFTISLYRADAKLK